jgi:hypothetical protein
MTRNDDFIGSLEGYLDEYEGSTPLPNDVRDAIRAQLPSIQQRRATWWPARRFLIMNSAMRFGLATLVVVAIAAVAIGLVSRGPETGGLDLGDPSPTQSPSTVPTTSPSASGAPHLDPGARIGPPTAFSIPFTFTVPGDGWTIGGDLDGTYTILHDDIYGVTAYADVQVYADPCRPDDGFMRDTAEASVEELAADLSGLPDAVASDPVPIEIDGHAGLQMDFTAPPCSFEITLLHAGTDDVDKFQSGVHQRFTILDVGGSTILLEAWRFGELDPVLADLDALIASISFQ